MKTVQVTKSFFISVLLCAVLFVLAVWSRFYGLEIKPLHFDESINGWFVMKMHQQGFYKYDPNNYHGPLYFYLLQLCELFWGSSLRVLRVLPSFFSVAAVMMFVFPLGGRRYWTLATGVLILFSPAFIFFGRSGIHEMPFVFFQMLFAAAIMRWLAGKKDSTALGMALVGLFGLVTLKETFAIFLFAAVVALLPLGSQQWKKSLGWADLKAAWTKRLTLWFILLFILFLGLFAGFGRNPSGILDFVRAFLPWAKTGVHGAGHDKEFLYWIKVLWEAEPLALAGLILSFWGAVKKDPEWRWISVFGLVQFLVYSWIPYKTVWCILSLVWPFYFVLGLSIERAIALRSRSLIIAGSLMLILGGVVGWGSVWRGVYQDPIDLEHPYVYVNTTHEFKEFSDGLVLALKDIPDLKSKTFQIGGREQWPWPWVLRRSEALNFTLCRKQIIADAFVYICDKDTGPFVEDQMKEAYLKWELPLRQHQIESVVYMKAAIFAPYFPGLKVVGPGAEDSANQQESP